MPANLKTRAVAIAAAFAMAWTANAAAPATFDIASQDFRAELYQVAVGDFNHAGQLDIAGTSQKGKLVYVYLGEGGGAFVPPATVTERFLLKLAG